MSTESGSEPRCWYCGSTQIAMWTESDDSPTKAWCADCWEKATVKMNLRKRNIRDFGKSDLQRRSR